MKVVYLKSALRDLANIRAYIGREDEEAARRVIARIEYSVERLASFLIRDGPVREESGSFPCRACRMSLSIVFKTKR